MPTHLHETPAPHRDPAAWTYERLLRQLVQLIRADQGDNEKADLLRDRMDKSWYCLTTAEQKQMRELSARLHEEA